MNTGNFDINLQGNSTTNQIIRQSGSNESEERLAEIIDNTFLKLWSYPNPHRANKPPKEICDALVTFGSTTFIFSDKRINFNTRKDDRHEWKRWYKKAVTKSKRQLHGALKHLKQCPENIYVDSRCETPFPFTEQVAQSQEFFLIAIAGGGNKGAAAHFNTGTNKATLPIMTGSDDEPDVFTLPHALPKDGEGFVHVFDPLGFQCVLSELDTINDLKAYLVFRENQLSTGAFFAPGEEDLLGYYFLKLASTTGEVNPHPRMESVESGFWEKYCSSGLRERWKAANKNSYEWDNTINAISEHLLANTQRSTSHVNDRFDIEVALRLMAQEPRCYRRELVAGIEDLILRTQDKTFRKARIFRARCCGHASFVVVIFKNTAALEYEYYRAARYSYLNGYLQSAAVVLENKGPIVALGIGIDDGSYDLLYADTANWTPSDWEAARQSQEETGFFSEIIKTEAQAEMYPPETGLK